MPISWDRTTAQCRSPWMCDAGQVVVSKREDIAARRGTVRMIEWGRKASPTSIVLPSHV
jgi:hypothetical protein